MTFDRVFLLPDCLEDVVRKEIPGKSQTCCSFTVILFETLFLYRFATQIEAKFTQNSPGRKITVHSSIVLDLSRGYPLFFIFVPSVPLNN